MPYVQRRLTDTLSAICTILCAKLRFPAILFASNVVIHPRHGRRFPSWDDLKPGQAILERRRDA
jgi:hypothetical protein